MSEAAPLARPVFGLRILERRLPQLMRRVEPTGIWVLLDRKVEPVLGRALERALAATDLPHRVIRFTASEKNKSLAQLEKLAGRFLRAGADRGGLILGVGGGITTDVAGFLAATLMRGCAWGAVPTTLLGMADAAIGGKTAVNLPEGKNLLGAFHQPRFVLADVASLRTLPDREWGCGLGEVLKSGMIASPALLRRIESTPPRAIRRAGAEALALAKAAAGVKVKIVAADPLEGGERKLLNLGHTFGHALETAAGPRKLAHGEAVGLGLLCAARMAVDTGRARPVYAAQVLALLQRCGLPSRYPGKLPSPAELTRLIGRDKKKAGKTVDVILPIRPGRCEILPGQQPRELAAVIAATLG
ncbi:MAG: 3-dehydroquinate synthase [Planctomycetes bacterium]|nr:3-dehydroquinate synthase [Planctomycetota bacterium]